MGELRKTENADGSVTISWTLTEEDTHCCLDCRHYVPPEKYERNGSCGLTEKRVYGVGKCKRWEHEVYNRREVSQ